ncbi:MAG: NAD-dependent epimerase/dehydratase family protein [Planctomycetes bacterium]|nr:NAD-dependent epimerase/dehydratase family protein [Planctomycetota bacterium]
MRAFVTGGGGFLGSAIVRLLRARGDEVTSFSRGEYPQLAELGARHIRGDLSELKLLVESMRGHDTVFHVAAKAGIALGREPFWQANVDGTRHVLAAALELGVERLVFTSSPSVCFDGGDHVNASNDLPYCARFLAPYPESKAAAERMVLAANGRSALATCALRPHLVFGPGDPQLVPRLLERGRARQLAIVGKGRNEVSLTFVENAAWAHLDAADRLAKNTRHAGKAYFIAQREPVVLWNWIHDLFGALGIPPVTRRIPLPIAYAVGMWLENLAKPEVEARMTRFLALQLSTSHSYDLGPAERDFGYVERVSMSDATRLTIESLRAQP